METRSETLQILGSTNGSSRATVSVAPRYKRAAAAAAKKPAIPTLSVAAPAVIGGGLVCAGLAPPVPDATPDGDEPEPLGLGWPDGLQVSLCPLRTKLAQLMRVLLA